MVEKDDRQYEYKLHEDVHIYEHSAAKSTFSLKSNVIFMYLFSLY